MVHAGRQKIGPDGCLYVMDWYDRYHCYQDANRDSPGLDRLKGRIYRISYKRRAAAKPFDLQKLSTDELIKLLAAPTSGGGEWPSACSTRSSTPRWSPTLQKMALDTADRNNAPHARAVAAGQPARAGPGFHEQVLASTRPGSAELGRAGAAGRWAKVSPGIFDKLKALAADPSPDVRVQVAVAAGRFDEPDPLPLLQAMLDNPANAKDPLIPVIIYNNLKPLGRAARPEILAIDGDRREGEDRVRREHAPLDHGVDQRGPGRDPGGGRRVAEKARSARAPTRSARQALQTRVDAFTAGGVKPDDRKSYSTSRSASGSRSSPQAPRRRARPALAMSLWWKEPAAIDAARKIVADPKADAAVARALLKALAEGKVPAAPNPTWPSRRTTDARSSSARRRSRRSPTPATSGPQVAAHEVRRSSRRT